MTDEAALDDLHASMLWREPPNLRPDQGREAFEQHILLAVAVHRAACLYRTDGDGKAWRKYVTAFFPPGRNDPEDAELLWKGWRTALVKNEQPIVPITHGQPGMHWVRVGGIPVLNLESAWNDYKHSVDQFIEHLRSHPEERVKTLERWRERSWTVRQFRTDSSPPKAIGTVMGASAANSIVWPDR